MQNELLPGSRAAALREVLRSLECDAATRAFLDGFMPDVPGVKPFVPVGTGYTEHLLRAIAATGAGFSIDTLAELQPLLSLGVDGRAVLYRNTEKQPADVRAAALRGVWRFAVGSQRELQMIASAAPGAAVYVYVAVQRARIGDRPPTRRHRSRCACCGWRQSWVFAPTVWHSTSAPDMPNRRRPLVRSSVVGW